MPQQVKAAARAQESRLKKKKHEQKMESAGGMRWLLTYADMITLLLALFIILFSISTISKVKYQALVHEISGGFNNDWAINNPPNGGVVGSAQGGKQSENLQQIQAALDQYIKVHKLEDKVKTRTDRRGLVISLLTDKALYDSGSADLRPATRQVLDEVSSFLKSTDNYIRVEGNTDNVPINTAAYPTNWELSAARAIAVTRYLVEKDTLSPERISPAGYGEWRPITDNKTEGHRQLNRRVDIVILNSKTSQVERQR